MAAIKIKLEWPDNLGHKFLTIEEIMQVLFSGRMSLNDHIKVTEIKDESSQEKRLL